MTTQTLLKRFITSFQKAITTEMEAMRQRLGPFEVPLSAGTVVDMGDNEQERFYTFKIAKANEKLALQTECTLRYEAGEQLVTITDLGQTEVTIRSERKIDLGYQDYVLVIYPWFLYERLKLALESLLESEDYFVSNALLLFGKEAPQKQPPHPLRADHTELNHSQQQAVQLCSDSNLAFVWGPPGTGKTTTLGHIVTELLAQGQRLLITSTTNAAVDQALAKLAALPDMQNYLEQGQIVRLGQANAETFGTGLNQVVKRLNVQIQGRLEQMRRRRQEIGRQIEQLDLILAKIKDNIEPVQLGLFHEARSEALSARELQAVFSGALAQTILQLSLEKQEEAAVRRRKRLERLSDLYRERISQYAQELRSKERTVTQKARLILATMSNVYLSHLLQGERFDTVIIEEAGMAILPNLFYCAALARKKVIAVGDPKQLPPIVQSKDEYVYKAMGRNIFEVSAQNPDHAGAIMMLDTQYRMHPLIGDLVSALFYDGKLRNGENTRTRGDIANKKPYPGFPLVVVDTGRQTTCATQEASFSRFNEKTAQACLDLALEAVRDGLESVAIITPYVAQSRLIRQQLSRFQREAQYVECQTVHRFQGGERDLVILDMVDTAPLPPGVLLADHSARSSSKNLINVSISRARGKLIIISDVAYFRDNSPRSVINIMLDQAIREGMKVSLESFA